MSNKKVILNYLPPSLNYHPSIALSILKSFLSQFNYNTKIIYWNLLLDTMLEKEKKLIKDTLKQNIISLYPYLFILAEEYNDQNALKNIFSAFNKLNINNLIGENLLYEKDYNIKKFIEIKIKILNIISTELDKIDFNEVLCWGISGKFFQWISGYILAREIKKRDPKAPIVIGGFGSREEAFEVLKSCENFDYAIYGEGEYPLLDFCNFIEKGTPQLQDIPRLVYRKNQEIHTSVKSNSKYLDFNNYIFPDYSDYFMYLDYDNTLKIKNNIIFLINSIRSCHWGKCKFCNFNAGYSYRERSPESIVQEIDTIVDKYGIFNIYFVNNDLIGKDLEKFECLLDLLITSNLKYDLKYNFGGELIINKNLNFEIYKKIRLAGFNLLFAGYEAVTDDLLKKMDKPNRFSNNILFLKACNKYDILAQANIIYNIPEETASDVQESRKNLHFLRFFFHNRLYDFSHYNIEFCLIKKTIYNKLLSEEEKQNYEPEKKYYMLPSNIISDPFNIFSYNNKKFLNSNEWEIFKEVESYYIKHIFNYKILKNNDTIYYFEYLDRELFTSLILDESDFAILKAANDKVISLDDMLKKLLKTYSSITENEIKEILTNLKKQYLIYYNDDYSNIISIIDTDILE